MIVKSQRNVFSDCNGYIYTIYSMKRNTIDIKSNLAMSNSNDPNISLRVYKVFLYSELPYKYLIPATFGSLSAIDVSMETTYLCSR